MTRRLVLVRHAKAAEAATDHERPLAPRGESDSVDLGRWLQGEGVDPDRVVVSTSLRTRQTWTGLSEALSSAPTPEYDGRIYDNAVEDLIDVLRESDAGSRTVLLVGHNPAVQQTALYLEDGGGDAESGRRARGKFPTSAVAILEIRDDWADLGPGGGRLIGYSEPSLLK